jgi:hypothetical protein
MEYKMTTIADGTRLRMEHDTFSSYLETFRAKETLTGDQMWVAPADGEQVKKGDEWMHVTHRNGVPLSAKGWTARKHKGLLICDGYMEFDTNTDDNHHIEIDIIDRVVSVTVDGKVFQS